MNSCTVAFILTFASLLTVSAADYDDATATDTCVAPITAVPLTDRLSMRTVSSNGTYSAMPLLWTLSLCDAERLRNTTDACGGQFKDATGALVLVETTEHLPTCVDSFDKVLAPMTVSSSPTGDVMSVTLESSISSSRLVVNAMCGAGHHFRSLGVVKERFIREKRHDVLVYTMELTTVVLCPAFTPEPPSPSPPAPTVPITPSPTQVPPPPPSSSCTIGSGKRYLTFNTLNTTDVTLHIADEDGERFIWTISICGPGGHPPRNTARPCDRQFTAIGMYTAGPDPPRCVNSFGPQPELHWTPDEGLLVVTAKGNVANKTSGARDMLKMSIRCGGTGWAFNSVMNSVTQPKEDGATETKLELVSGILCPFTDMPEPTLPRGPSNSPDGTDESRSTSKKVAAVAVPVAFVALALGFFGGFLVAKRRLAHRNGPEGARGDDDLYHRLNEAN